MFASKMKGRGGLKGRSLSLVRTPPRLPLFLRRSSGGRLAAGFALQGAEKRSWRSSSRLKVSCLYPLVPGCSTEQMLRIHKIAQMIQKILYRSSILSA